jgi:hypothetical protein
MKNFIFAFFILCFSISNAQEAKTATSETDDTEVAYAIIEEVPVYSGCENLEGNFARKKCMNKELGKLIRTNFNSDLAQQNGISGRIKIGIFFKIGKDGNIKDIEARTDYKVMEEEAIRVVNLIPQMEPGIQRGQPVTVPYYLPLRFVVEKEEPKPLTKKELKAIKRAKRKAKKN